MKLKFVLLVLTLICSQLNSEQFLPFPEKEVIQSAVFTPSSRISVSRERLDIAFCDEGIALAIAEEKKAADDLLAGERKLIEEVNTATQSEASESPLSILKALYFTLYNQRQIAISELNLFYQKGVAEESAEPFDVFTQDQLTYHRVDNFQIPYTVRTHHHQYETTAAANISKSTRLGTSFNANLSVDKIHNKYLYEIKALPAPTVNKGFISFQITQPLLKGFINSYKTMFEQSSQALVWARYYDSLQSIASALLNTLNAYWQLVAAERSITVILQSIDRIQKIINDSQVLVNEGLMAPNDFNQPLLQMATRRSQLYVAEQMLFTQQEQLKFYMGFTSPCEKCIDTFTSKDSFPSVQDAPANLCQMLASWTQKALKDRYDLQSLRTTIASNALLLRGRNNDLLPQVDLFYEVNASNFRVGHKAKPLFSAFDRSGPQVERIVGVNFSAPLYNDGPKGRYVEAYATYLSSIQQEQLAVQNILNNLRSFTSNQMILVPQIAETQKAVEVSNTLVTNKYIKLKYNEDDIFELLNLEDKVVTNELLYIQYLMQYAQNIAQIRFYTNTLFAESPTGDVQIQDILTLPCLN